MKLVCCSLYKVNTGTILVVVCLSSLDLLLLACRCQNYSFNVIWMLPAYTGLSVAINHLLLHEERCSHAHRIKAKKFGTSDVY